MINILILVLLIIATSYTSQSVPIILDDTTYSLPKVAVINVIVHPSLLKSEIKLIRELNLRNVTIAYIDLWSVAQLRALYNATRDLNVELVPFLLYTQRLSPGERVKAFDIWMRHHYDAFGEYPRGFFDWNPDSLLVAYGARKYGIRYVVGFVWDQFNIDFMTVRGSYPFPYYPCMNNFRVPCEKSPFYPVVALPSNTFDWSDTEHNINTHPIDNRNLTSIMKLYELTPFYVTTSIELYWLIDLKDKGEVKPLKNFKELIKWIYKTFKVMKAGDYAELFIKTFDKSPTYHFITDSLIKGRVEWYFSPKYRIMKVGNKVVNFLNYTMQDNDPYLNDRATINLSGSPTDPKNQINTSLQFTIDSYIRGNRGDLPIIYNGLLNEFPDYYNTFLKGNKKQVTSTLKFVIVWLLISMIILSTLYLMRKKLKNILIF